MTNETPPAPYRTLSPLLLGILAFHGRVPQVVAVYGDLQTPSKVTALDPEAIPLVPPERVGVLFAESDKSTDFRLVATLAGAYYLSLGDRKWARVLNDSALSALLPAGFWKDARLEPFLAAQRACPTLAVVPEPDVRAVPWRP